jgi:hypothetical protein
MMRDGHRGVCGFERFWLARIAAIAFCVVIFAGWARAQSVWRVNIAGGPAAHFTDLPAAVLVAQPGDTILFWISASPSPPPGWSGYTAPVIDKPIRLVGLSTGSPSLPGISAKGLIRGVIRVRNIAQGETCLIANVTMDTVKSGVQGIHIEDCAGSVVLDGFEFYNPGYDSQYLRVERSANVLLQGGLLHLAGSGVVVVDSTIAIQRSQFWIGSSAIPWPGTPPLATTSFAPLGCRFRFGQLTPPPVGCSTWAPTVLT